MSQQVNLYNEYMAYKSKQTGQKLHISESALVLFFNTGNDYATNVLNDIRMLALHGHRQNPNPIDMETLAHFR